MRKQINMKLGFPELINVSGRNTIKDLYPVNSSGIYLLKFPDGDYYVGQARNVVRRFSDHIKRWGYISGFSFFPVPASQLNEVEQNCIGALDKKCRLRNISLVSSPVVDSQLDALIPQQMQEYWLSSFKQTPTVFTRHENNILRKKYEQKFQKLKSNEMFIYLSLPVMQKYVKYCILEPYLTEISFWGCSCLPSFNNPEVKVHSRINIYWQEVLYVGFDLVYKTPFYGFFVLKSDLKNEIKRLKSEYPSLVVRDLKHLSGGADQCHPCLYSLQDALRILDDPVFRRAIKSFNLSTMRKGILVYSRYHCMDLADYLLANIREEK